MVPRTLYIHVGPAKTGTSAVQSLLQQHDNSFLIYPKVGLWGPGSHQGLVRSFFGERSRGKAPFGSPQQLFREIAAEVNSADRNVLVSSESFGPHRRAATKRDLPTFVDALLEHFKGHWRVEVLVTCRDHFELAASGYSQRIRGKESSECDGPDDYLLNHIDELKYAPLIESLRLPGYAVTALNYHPAHTWMTRFLTHVGMPTVDVPGPSRNVSLSVKALIAKLSANRTLEAGDERGRFLNLLKRMPGYSAPSQFIFGHDAAAVGDLVFNKDKQFLANEVGVDLPGSDPSKRENMFFIDSNDLEEIRAIARQFGPMGDAIAEAAREYHRPR